ncbi:MAG: hypothetical protein GY929_19365 [Actinomycetia bacterium]|nr:hypothetical protein [Actinomycetes bacterium]
MSLLSRWFTRLVVGAVVVAVLAAGCSSDPASDASREADAYEAILRWIIDRTDDDVATGENETRLVFIDNLGPDEIPLDIQVELVARLAEEAKLRFVDELEEAIDVDIEDRPVRDGGVLVGLGVVPDEPPVEVRGELYLGIDDVHGWRFPLMMRAGRWELRDEPEVVDPEGLVEAP